MEQDLTKGSVLKTVVSFSLPYLLSYFLQTLYGMADLFLIGQFGGVAGTTAVAVGSQIMHMVTVMLVGIAMGTTVMLGQAVGAGDRPGMSRTVGNTITLFLGLALCLMAVLLLLVNPIVRVMSTPEEAVEGTRAYITICFLGVPFITAYNILSAIFRGLGDSKSPMYVVAVACVCNITLDILFMGVMGLGPTGAALGTTISQSISVVLAVIVIWRKKAITVHKKDLRPYRETLGRLLKIGVPVSLQDGFIQISFIILTIIANRRGLTDAAAVGVVEKIIGILFLVPSTMLSTVSALSAQNIGARRLDRANRTLFYGAAIAVGWGLLVSIVMLFRAEFFVGLFTSDSEAIARGGMYMRGYVWDCMFAGIHFSFSGYFYALSKSGISFVHNALSIVLVRIPLAYWTSAHFPDNLLPMGLASTLGSLFSVLICVGAFVYLLRRSTAEQRMTS